MTLASILAVLGAWLGFANPVYRLPVLVLLYPAGLTLVAVRAASPARAARSGFWIGSLAALGTLYWTVLPVHDYGGLAWPLALPIPALLAMLPIEPGGFDFLPAASGVPELLEMDDDMSASPCPAVRP